MTYQRCECNENTALTFIWSFERLDMNILGKKIAAFGFLLFLALFVAGIIRSFFLQEPDLPDLTMRLSSPLFSKDEYRSELRTANNLAQIGLIKTPLPQVLDQENLDKIRVYEKTAQLASGTTDFPVDEERIRTALTTQKATVFNERRTGITPDRKLALGIAVPPRSV